MRSFEEGRPHTYSQEFPLETVFETRVHAQDKDDLGTMSGDAVQCHMIVIFILYMQG
jgi:hypothetical protein